MRTPGFWLIVYVAGSFASIAWLVHELMQLAVDELTLIHHLTDGLNLTFLANFLVCQIALFGYLSTYVVFGSLRIIEIEHLADRLPFYGLSLLFIMFNSDNLLLNISWASCLIVAKLFSIILIDRLDFVQLKLVNSLTGIDPPTSLRVLRTVAFNLYVNILLIFMPVTLFIAKVLAFDLFLGISSMGSLLFGVQFGVIGLEAFVCFGKLILNTYEMVFYMSAFSLDDSDDEEAGELVWESKGLFEQGIEIIALLLKTVFYAVFIYILYVHSNQSPPLNIVQGCFFASLDVLKRCQQFMKILKLSKILDNALADATMEEIEAADSLCIICREDMCTPEKYKEERGKNLHHRRRPKKLSCGHILHIGCLRDWLERSDNCPLCRQKVFSAGNGNTPPDTAQAATAQPPPQAQPGAGPVPLAPTATAAEPQFTTHTANATASPPTPTQLAESWSIPPDWEAFPITSIRHGEFRVVLLEGNHGVLRLSRSSFNHTVLNVTGNAEEI